MHDFRLYFCGTAKAGRPLYIERSVATVTYDGTTDAYVIDVHMIDDFKEWVAMAWDVDCDDVDAMGIDDALYAAGVDVRFNEVTA